MKVSATLAPLFCCNGMEEEACVRAACIVHDAPSPPIAVYAMYVDPSPLSPPLPPPHPSLHPIPSPSPTIKMEHLHNQLRQQKTTATGPGSAPHAVIPPEQFELRFDDEVGSCHRHYRVSLDWSAPEGYTWTILAVIK
jgi:hypothetical protein